MSHSDFDLFFISRNGWSLLDVAIKANQIEVVQFLLSSPNKERFLQPREGTPPPLVLAYDNPEMTRLLLDAGVDINQQSNGLSLLMMAAAKDNEKFVDFLLSQPGIDVDLKYPNGRTSLMVCSSPVIAAKLIDHGANKDAVDNRGTSVLLYSAYYQFWEKVILLMESGANPSVKNKSGLSVMDVFSDSTFDDEDVRSRVLQLLRFYSINSRADQRV